MIAAVSQADGLVDYLIHPRSISTPEFIEFIQRLSEKFGGQDFSIFMDNLSVHKTKLVQQEFLKLKITPIYNVPYSP